MLASDQQQAEAEMECNLGARNAHTQVIWRESARTATLRLHDSCWSSTVLPITKTKDDLCPKRGAKSSLSTRCHGRRVALPLWYTIRIFSNIHILYHKGTVDFPCGIFSHKALSSISRTLVVFCNLSLWEKGRQNASRITATIVQADKT